MSTRKPCHGCGSMEPHDTGKLCHDCVRKLESAEKAIKSWNERMARTECCKVPDPSWYPGFWTPDGMESERLSKALGQVLSHFCEPTIKWENASADHIIPKGRYHPGHDWWSYVRLSKEQLAAWNDLDNAVRETLEVYYQSGVKYGTSLLVRLADGNISIEEFEKERAG